MPQTLNRRLALNHRVTAWGRGVVCWLLLQVLAGCSDPVIWSSGECRSSYDDWIAKAYTVQHGGFGTAGVETIVEIRRSSDSYPTQPRRVLTFDDGGNYIKLRMQWDRPSHLLVTYAADPKTLYYQVLKTSGVDISVHNEWNGINKRL